jgi:hypothetical protein
MMPPTMRTTLTLADELAVRAKPDAEQLGLSFKDLINRALEIGLERIETGTKMRWDRTESTPVGLREGLRLRRYRDLLAETSRGLLD